MDQLRHLMYNPPAQPNPWDPSRARSDGKSINTAATPLPGSVPATFPSSNGDVPPPVTVTHGSPGSKSSSDGISPSSSRKDLAHELEVVLNRGHPNIVKLLDFFEDHDFYYCKSILTMSITQHNNTADVQW
jgi:hypothetical protein